MPAPRVVDLVAEARRAAGELLGCRPDASAAEVRAAYRRQVKDKRPDVGGADAAWLSAVQGARDLLLVAAAPDRRRRPRRPGPPGSYLPLRRSTWLPDAAPSPEVDLRL